MKQYEDETHQGYLTKVAKIEDLFSRLDDTYETIFGSPLYHLDIFDSLIYFSEVIQTFVGQKEARVYALTKPVPSRYAIDPIILHMRSDLNIARKHFTEIEEKINGDSLSSHVFFSLSEEKEDK